MAKKKHSKKKDITSKFDKTKHFKAKKSQSLLIDEEIKTLESKYKEINPQNLNHFKDFPLTAKTKKGLQNGKYEIPTDIQKESIVLALAGNDILGAAKTGSGKTLAFLIPVLECLYKAKWTQLDGLGALIISPTRELAYQIFEVLRLIGKFHDFSAGLVIGGKHLRDEAERINKTNIVICTPGRLLQHMDETVNFNADNLQVLVLDEADRILDMGFQESMNAVIQNLPAKRQTLLFSATQTKSVKDLARLSLKNPMYVSVHEKSQYSTPTQLQQSYVVCELHEKLDVLWSFMKNHVKKKILVFLSSCKQVRFVYEAFQKLHPGITVLSLHGAMHQMKRVATYDAFCRKQSALLFATDIAARGLDFPAVHWVIQVDCPEDANTYIHRAGRTARYEENGESLLMLLPSEEKGMLNQLAEKKIPVKKIRINIKKMSSIQPRLESLCASEIQMKEFAQRAFMAYIKSVFFMKNKSVFNVTKLDTDSLARSLGLAIPPRIRFLQKALEQKKENQQLQKQKDKTQTERNQDDTTSVPSHKQVSDSNENDDTSDSEDDEESGIKDIMKPVNRLKKIATTESSPSDSEEESEDDNTDSDDAGSSNDAEERTNFGLKYKGSDNDTKNEEVLMPSKSKETTGSVAKLSKKNAVFSFGVEEDGDELLKTKSKSSLCTGDDSSDDEDLDATVDGQKQNKAMTKAAIAKRILKKNLSVNTKVTFDDEGQEVVNLLKKAVDVGDSEDFSIEEARKRMKEADKLDKELFRQKIKQRKLEKKIKEKEKRRGLAEDRRNQSKDPVVYLGTENSDESDKEKMEFNSEDEDSFNSEDMDNETYSGENKDSDDYNSDKSDQNIDRSDGSSVESEDDLLASKQRMSRKRRKGQDKASKEVKKSKTENTSSGQSLVDDEELALKLLMTS